jgi:hypothetical protein
MFETAKANKILSKTRKPPEKHGFSGGRGRGWRMSLINKKLPEAIKIREH